MPRPLSNQEKEALWIALNCRKNLIETGSPSMSAEDVKKMGDKIAKEHRAAINPLSIDQMKLLILTEELRTKILSDKILVMD